MLDFPVLHIQDMSSFSKLGSPFGSPIQYGTLTKKDPTLDNYLNPSNFSIPLNSTLQIIN